MDRFVNLQPVAGAQGSFDLDAAVGTLTLKQIDGLEVFCIRRTDGQPIALAVGAPIDVASVRSDQIIVRTATGQAGLFEV